MSQPGPSLEVNLVLIEAALQNALGRPVTVTKLQRLTAGATKQTWRLDVAVQGVPQALILQTLPPSKLQSSEGPQQRTLTPEQDARIAELARQR
jgi:hypothetical protein